MRSAAIAALLALTGCATTTYDPYVAAVENQLQTRSYQTRQLEGSSYDELVAAIIGTLQDYHFRIQLVDPELGAITAYQVTKQGGSARTGGRAEITVLVRKRREHVHSVRINMALGPTPEERPELYQSFFSALSRRLHYQRDA